MSIKGVAAALAAFFAPRALADSFPPLNETYFSPENNGAVCYYRNGVEEQADSETLGVSVGQTSNLITEEIVCPRTLSRLAFRSLYYGSENVLHHYLRGYPHLDSALAMSFREHPPFGTGLDPLRKIDKSIFREALASLQVAAGKLDQLTQVTKHIWYPEDKLKALGQAGADTYDAAGNVCRVVTEVLKGSFASFASLCEEVRVSSDAAIEAAHYERRDFVPTQHGYTQIILPVLPGHNEMR
ncbi:hypothetical protein FOZ63_028959 [Perkinsus olseni]|uniref:Uncharacterized protein n=1 Tax=Perkinsus olseni TaxID=32597 RepID=A0A7J6NX53_PEROL|nr:hypothetical protein FOZ63_028959 [Perkinsus olseni]